MGDDLAAAVDELVAVGVVTSRSDAVRVALRQLVDRYREIRSPRASSPGTGVTRNPTPRSAGPTSRPPG